MNPTDSTANDEKFARYAALWAKVAERAESPRPYNWSDRPLTGIEGSKCPR